jgi:hypothetical protein
MHRQLAFIAFGILSACAPVAIATPTPGQTALVGTVTLDFPPDGAQIYAELIQISGMALDIPDNQFVLRLTDSAGLELQRAVVKPTSPAWQIELPHTYDDTPVEVTLTAQPDDMTEPYTARTLILAGIRHRPEGAFGSITQPTDQTTVGGDVIPVSGTASGVPDNILTVQLHDTENHLITEQTITIHNPYFVDVMPWSTEIATSGYSGPATISIHDEQGTVLETIQITMDTAAG